MNISMGTNIKTARKKMGLTQEELASQLGVTAQAVSRWESEVGMPDISMVVPLAQTLSVSTDTLFGLVHSSYDELHYQEIESRMDELYDGTDQAKSALEVCRYLYKEIQKDFANYSVLSLFTERAANLSRYVDYDGYAKDEWPDIRGTAINSGLRVIRYSTDRKLIERTHFALAWIYIHEKDYDSAREHIGTLPSVASNRLQESILADLAVAEYGIEAGKDVLRKNLQNFTRAINKEIRYAIEAFCWNATPEETISLGKWGLRIISILSENTDMISFCRGFTRDCHQYLISAYLKLGKYKEAADQFGELQKDMERHFKYYQTVLQSEAESKKFDANNLRYMRAYTEEFILKTQKEMLAQLKGWHDEEVYDMFSKGLQ